MFKRLYNPEFIILFILCFIFYGALHFYASNAMDGVKTIEVVRRVMLLRTIFSFVFAALLGFIGVKMTGQVWPATLVHAFVVAIMLSLDLSITEMMQDWMLVLIIVGIVASITALGGGLTLAYYWFRMRR